MAALTQAPVTVVPDADRLIVFAEGRPMEVRHPEDNGVVMEGTFRGFGVSGGETVAVVESENGDVRAFALASRNCRFMDR